METFNWVSGVVFPVVNFALFLFILYKFGKKPAADSARKRRDDFEALFNQAQQTKLEAEKKLAEINARLSNLKNEIETLKQQSLEDAQREADKIVNNARELANHFRSEAGRMAEVELLKAEKKLQSEVIEQVKKNVVDKLSRSLNSDQHIELINSRISGLKL